MVDFNKFKLNRSGFFEQKPVQPTILCGFSAASEGQRDPRDGFLYASCKDWTVDRVRVRFPIHMATRPSFAFFAHHTWMNSLSSCARVQQIRSRLLRRRTIASPRTSQWSKVNTCQRHDAAGGLFSSFVIETSKKRE